MSYSVIGNTSGFGPEESRFEPLWDNKNNTLSSNGRTSGFEPDDGGSSPPRVTKNNE